MTEEQEKPSTSEPEPTLWGDFIVSAPPGTMSRVSQCNHKRRGGGGGYVLELTVPSIVLYCTTCEGDRYFDGGTSGFYGLSKSEITDGFLHYVCRNCHEARKSFAFLLQAMDNTGLGQAIKIGEWPPFGKRVPTRLKALVKHDWDLFFKGWHAEQQGMGIAAFTYYRRVLDDQKNRLIDRMIAAAKSLDVPEPVITQFEAAKQESQFARALEGIQDVLPNGLFLAGQNPLKVLHNALSEGIHALSDEECLDRAANIMIVLTAFAERLHEVLKDQDVVAQAIGKLTFKTTGGVATPTKKP